MEGGARIDRMGELGKGWRGVGCGGGGRGVQASEVGL